MSNVSEAICRLDVTPTKTLANILAVIQKPTLQFIWKCNNIEKEERREELTLSDFKTYYKDFLCVYFYNIKVKFKI